MSRDDDAVAAESSYLPIHGYAFIGDCHGSALISKTGSIDWCCLERFDADPIFLRLLDAKHGGVFAIQPRSRYTSQQCYLDSTNILRTEFETETGRVSVTDFMAVGRQPGSGTHDYVSLLAPGWLIRLVDGSEGRVPMRMAYQPSLAFGRKRPRLVRKDGHIAMAEGPALYLRQTPHIDGETATCEFEVQAGERHQFVLTSRPLSDPAPLTRIPQLFDITKAFWIEWIAYCRYQGPHRAQVLRSALALKLMTYAPSGAMVAAPTCSLPEEIGGVRNWDYRYCWLRDSAFMLYALAVLGYGGEAREFSKFLRSCCIKSLPQIQIMYGVETETDLCEKELTHLDGYRGSRPVRVGNDAYRQRQIDIFGELLDWAQLFHALGGRFDPRGKHLLESLADYVAAHWEGPDQGIWEIRGPPRHHVFGKVMSWVALDRALGILGHRDDWARTKQKIAMEIRERGLARDHARFRNAYEDNSVDAVLLLLPMLGFPADADVVANTVAAVERDLKHGRYVRRYRTSDGLEGVEGAFLVCGFWLVDALLFLDRSEEARTLFEDLCRCVNHVGLLPEEIDPASGEFLGNFPQALAHLGLIGSAINLQIYERHGAGGLRGSHADRARLSVTATLGWRGIWSAFRASGRIGRIFSSPRSVLRPSLLW